MGIIVYNGKSSQEYSVLVEHPPGYEYPEKDLIITHVPGRNGDVVFDNNSYKNVDREYEVAVPAIRDSYETAVNKISEWLHSSSSYARLEDSYEPEYFRQAIYKESNIFECIYRQAGKAKIKFNCKPQRFLKIGERPIYMVNTSGINHKEMLIMNPTGFESLPIINIKMSKSTTLRFSINNNLVEVKDTPTDKFSINSIIKDCYTINGNLNINNIVSMSIFPYFKPGINTVNISTDVNFDIETFEIIPNWWTL